MDRKPPDQYHHGHLREALLEAADRVVEEQGLGALTLRELARRTNVSHAAPAYHFKSKPGLLKAYAALGFRRLGETMARTVREHAPEPPPERLFTSGVGYVRFAIDHPQQFEAMYQHALLDEFGGELAEASRKSWGVLTEAVKECVEQGYLDPADTVIVTIFSWAVAHGFADLWVNGRIRVIFRDDDAEAILERMGRIFRRILRDRPSA